MLIQQLFLVTELNNILNKIRNDKNVHPPMMWCPKCQKRTQSKFLPISITATYWALKRFDYCSKDEFKKLLNEWKEYSTKEQINIYGNPIEKRSLLCNDDHNQHEA